LNPVQPPSGDIIMNKAAGKTVRGSASTTARGAAHGGGRGRPRKTAEKSASRKEDYDRSDFVKEIEDHIREAELSSFLQGVTQGLDKGLHVGRLTALTEQMKRRFGPLPDGVDRRVMNGSSRELYVWLMNILTAQSLEEVFKDEDETDAALKKKGTPKSNVH
jgi:hypothetical protein